ncbi:hypothetical protein Taro_024772 [Colocasia esculenta]|uniref:Uncharacterized protein n=1 Tax=Colocasia esculenta TaxID=4460 RepID=A0A843VAB6_COLES|nr:hypothetical protein [Colocasia esculenta]
MEVWDVGACVVRLGSHVVALVFRDLLCLGWCVPRSSFASALLEFLLLWLLFEFIAYLTGLNSNPFGSSDPLVAVRPSGVPGGGPGGQVVSFPAGSECELQESVAAVAGCACFEVPTALATRPPWALGRVLKVATGAMAVTWSRQSGLPRRVWWCADPVCLDLILVAIVF